MTMQMNRRNALAAFAAAAVPGAWAQDRYPSRPIRIIVTNAAGGASDMIARMIGTGLTAALGQPVAVEPMLTLPLFRVVLSPMVTRLFYAVPRTSVARTASG
jgi:hypothetical protein